MSNPYSNGDKVICTKATSSNGRLTEGQTYTVKTAKTTRYITLAEVPGIYYTDRFKLAPKGKAKKTPFGQVRSVTVNHSDILHVLTHYVKCGLGIDATVTKIIDKFPEAVELVLAHEVDA